ncbi:MAG TPA: 4,5-DOPA dioxygenase extradiol [Burkholderiaceae bacterium]
MTPATLMPAAFIGHGSPMNTLEQNRFTSAWREFGKSVARPRAILVISAHWYIHGTALTAMPQPRTIHDFYGFPQPLFDFQYPAAGAPDIAAEIAEVVQPSFVALDADSWGLDHGTWSVLAHVFPKADIPVLQLSVHAGEDFSYHYELGKKLAQLRERGILVLASGNVVHNLRRLDWNQPDKAYGWAEEFDAEVTRAMLGDPAALADLSRHPAYAMAVPTPEHYLPLAYIAGLSAASGEPSQVLVNGGSMGSLTMTSFVVGAGPIGHGRSDEAAASVPNPAVVPPEQTNI